MGMLLIMDCNFELHRTFLVDGPSDHLFVPITFYSFFRYVYDFGPKHCKRIFYNIIINPVPGVEFEGCLGEADDFEALWHQRFNHNIVAW
jgi:hypothetical protein